MATLPGPSKMGPRPTPQDAGGVVSVPNAGAVESASFEATEGMLELAQNLKTAGERIQSRQEDIERLRAYRAYRKRQSEIDKEFLSKDISDPVVGQEYATAVGELKDEILQSIGNHRPESLSRATGKIDTLSGAAIGAFASHAAKRQHEQGVLELKDIQNEYSARIRKSPLEIHAIAGEWIEDVKDAPGDTVFKNEMIRDGLGRFAEIAAQTAFMIGDTDKARNIMEEYAPVLGEDRQRSLIKLMMERKSAAQIEQEAYSKEMGKLVARRDVMSKILLGADAEELPDENSVAYPFGPDFGVSDDAKDVTRMFLGARRLFAAGMTSEANSMLAQARFLAENSTDMKMADELNKPITSPDIAAELGVPVGTTYGEVIGKLPRSAEEKAETISAARARGRGRVEAESNIAFIEQATDLLDGLFSALEEDPKLVGTVGGLRAKGRTAIQVFSDLGMDKVANKLMVGAKNIAMQSDMPLQGVHDLFDDPELSTLKVLENSIGTILARLRNPDQRVLASMIDRSIEDVNLTSGGSKQVMDRLRVILDLLRSQKESMQKQFNIGEPAEEWVFETGPEGTLRLVPGGK